MQKPMPFFCLLAAAVLFCSSSFAQTTPATTDSTVKTTDADKKQIIAPEKPTTAEITPSDLTDQSTSSSATEETVTSETTDSSSESKDSKKTSKETEETGSGQTAAMAVGPGESPGNQIPGLNSLSVSVQPFSGSASVPITIEVPPGRAGIQPSIALVYSSSLPESFTGVGWNLDLGSIQRSTKKGPPKYNSSDTFVLMQNGSSSNLVLDPAGFYRQEIETSFSKIVSSGSGSSMTWVMTDKKGTKYFFGQTAASKQFDPADANKIFEWALDRVEDISGNYMTISYLKHGNELYPDTILYTGNSNTPTIATHAKVLFNYTDVARTLTSYKASFLVSSSKRLRNITVYANNIMVRDYWFTFTQSVSSKRYLLTSVKQYGADATSFLPVVTFTYQGDVKGFATETNWTMPDGAVFVYKESNGKWTDRGVRVADVNGDAYPDLVRATRACGDTYSNMETYLNNKQNGFTQTTSWVAPDAAQGFLRSCNEIDRPIGLQLLDANGDLWPDLVRHYYLDNGPAINKTFVNDKTGAFNETVAWASPLNTEFYRGWTDGDTLNILTVYKGVLDADVNGDGFNDIIISYDNPGWGGVNHNVYINQGVNGGTGWVQDPVWTTPTGSWPNGIMDFTHNGTLVELNGDGLPELVSFNSTTPLVVAMNNGHGWEPASLTTPWSTLPYDVQYTLGYSQFADINGDGLTDIVVGNGGYLKVIINTGSGWFDDSAAWTNTGSGYFVRLDQRMMDADADGMTDYIYSVNGYGFGGPTTEVHRNNGEPADLLVKIDNGIGGTTEIAYESSAHYTNTFLPFIVQVVKSVKVSYGTENYTTNYSYANGLWGADTREFRGFGQVKVTDPAGSYVVTNYLQDKIYKGMPSSQETYDSNNVLFAKTVNTWNKKILIAGDVSVFPYLQRSDSYLYDGAAPDRRTAQEFFYDEATQYGNMTKTIQYGEVNFSNGADIGSDKRTTETSYVNNSTLWLLGLPKQVIIKDNAGTQVRLTSFYYDNNPNLTDLPVKGRLTKRVRWNGTGPTPTDLYSYDTNTGNLLTTTDPLTNVTTITYDPMKIFPLTTTNALNHVVTTQYYGVNGVSWNDGAGLSGLWGQVKSVTDANNQTASRAYDTFGRIVKSISPLDSVTYPTTIYTYTYGSNYLSVMTRARRNHGVAGVVDTIAFYDGLGRLIQTKAKTTNANQYIVSGQTQYNSRGLPEYKYVPRFTSNSMTTMDPIDTNQPKVTLTYDAMGRSIQTTNPDGTYSSTVHYGWGTGLRDERGARISYYYDAYGRVIKAEEYSGYDGRSPTLYPASAYVLYSTTNYTYDSEGNLKTVVDNAGNTTTVNYDNLGRKISMTDPDMGAWSYTYDLNGNLLTQTDAKSQVITFTYDALNRLKTKTSGTTVNVTYNYDDTVNSGYAKGRLSNVTYTGGSTKFVYDKIGRETQSVKTIDGVPWTISRVYDALNNVTKIVYPDLSEVHYQYNSVGQLQAIANNASVLPPLVKNETPQSKFQTMFASLKEKAGKFYDSWFEPNFLGVKEAQAAAPNTLFVSAITYNANGQALTISYGNGAVTTQDFPSPMFRLARIYTVKGSTVLQDLNYTYDAIGNVRTIVDNVNTADQTFTYDHRNRLTQAVGSYGTYNYTYDTLGNISTKEGVTYTYSEVNAGPHAVTGLSDGSTLTYDLNGNRTALTKTGYSAAYTYDVENQLIDVKKNGVTVGQYFYDGDGGRVRKINYASGQAGNNTCFLAGTKIMMADGTTKSIEDIKVGDVVTSYDEKKMAKTSAKVTEMFDGERAKEYLLVNGSLKVTPNHKFYSQGKWVEIGKLKEGDLLFDENGEEIAIAKIEKVKSQNDIKVYNLEVEGEHNYYVVTSAASATSDIQARGVLVHNKLSYNPPAVSGVPVSSGVMTNYVGSLAEETKGTWVNKVFLGSTQIATVSSDQVRYYFHDHLGSANVVTDAVGTRIELMEYKPFGDFSYHQKYGSTENVAWYYFTGKPLDDETGLSYFGARYYSPILGRFLTPDTVVQAPMNPQTLNRYSYCNNNPVNLVDHDGHKWSWRKFAGSFVSGFISAIAPGLTGGALAGTLGAAINQTNVGQGAMMGAIGSTGPGQVYLTRRYADNTRGYTNLVLGTFPNGNLFKTIRDKNYDEYVGGQLGGLLGQYASSAVMQAYERASNKNEPLKVPEYQEDGVTQQDHVNQAIIDKEILGVIRIAEMLNDLAQLGSLAITLKYPKVGVKLLGATGTIGITLKAMEWYFSGNASPFYSALAENAIGSGLARGALNVSGMSKVVFRGNSYINEALGLPMHPTFGRASVQMEEAVKSIVGSIFKAAE